MKTVRVGAGSACFVDMIEPATELAERGGLSYLCFDSIAELTTVLMAKQKAQDPTKGYDPYLEKRFRPILPLCARNGTKIIGNMGVTNPLAAQDLMIALAKEFGLKGLKIAAVLGDDVLDLVQEIDPVVYQTGERVSAFGDRLFAANAYIPSSPIVEALRQGADVVITGRMGDSALFLAPLTFEFGWKEDDWDVLAGGMMIGHLMECAGQVTGGYYASPPHKAVPDLHRLGFPIAQVEPDGTAVITKLPGTGGTVTKATCTEQLLYETHDPAAYVHAEVIADFRQIQFDEVGPDQVRVSGVRGKPRPSHLKVLLGVHDGYMGRGEIFYGGYAAYERARLASDRILKRLEIVGARPDELSIDFIGVDSHFKSADGSVSSIPREVGVRVCGRCKDRETAELIAYEMLTLPCNGPAGGSCVFPEESVSEIAGVYNTFIPRDLVKPSLVIKEVN